MKKRFGSSIIHKLVINQTAAVWFELGFCVTHKKVENKTIQERGAFYVRRRVNLIVGLAAFRENAILVFTCLVGAKPRRRPYALRAFNTKKNRRIPHRSRWRKSMCRKYIRLSDAIM